jgi:hypothetical protein
MKLSKEADEIVLRLKEREYFVVLNALKAATADDTRKGIAYSFFYDGDKGEVVRLHNEIEAAEQSASDI